MEEKKANDHGGSGAVKRPSDPMRLDLAGGETVAMVSTRREGAPRWSELEVWFLPDVSGRCFVAESRGCSSIPGEVTKRQRIYVGTLDRALRMFDESDAGENVRLMAEDWLERNPGRVAEALKALRRFRGAPGGAQGYDGAGGLSGALAWLYQPPGVELTEGRLSEAVAQDFGVPSRTVRHALGMERDGKPLTGWAGAFVRALRWFDRDAFRKSKERTDADAS